MTICEFVEYDPINGSFRSKRTGKLIGSIKVNQHGPTPRAYIYIKINGKRYYAHRLAWFYTHGVWPDQIDHIDGNSLNNAMNNLRAATHSQNQANRKIQINNRLGIKGVRKNNLVDTYSVRLGKIHIGCYKTKEEAELAYISAARAKYGSFASNKRK